MGYDVKMFVGEVVDYATEDGRSILEIATVDLCNPGSGAVYHLSKVAPSDDYPAAYIYSFGTQQEQRVTEDFYGKRLAIVPASAALEALYKDSEFDDYRRFEIAIATLEVIIKRFPQDGLGVVFYGR